MTCSNSISEARVRTALGGGQTVPSRSAPVA
jgi:hypothetical protein